jgi:hypothetical protein
MAKGRIDLQPSITLAAITSQDLQSAGRVPGGAKSGLAVVTVTSVATSGNLVIATAPDLSADVGGWAPAGSSSSILASVGVKTIVLTGMADFICWKLTAISGSVTLSIVVYTFDA